MANYEYPFERLRVYQEARILVKSTYELLKIYPTEELYALCAQMRRAAISIPSNIAEGVGRTTLRDKTHFLEIAYGSLMELFSQFQLSADLGYISAEQFQSVRGRIDAVGQTLSGLRNNYIKRMNEEKR